MNVTYNSKPAIMRRNGRLVLGDVGGITFQFIALDLDGNELGATEQIKVETVSTETVTEVQATFVAKLATPQNVTANGTTVSWDAVENATSYDVYADDTTLLGNVTSQQSVDITTLPGWSSLSVGTHNITIVAKADGYIDSEKSAGVEVTREIPPDYLCFTAEEAGSTVAMAVNGTPTKGQVFEYSTDGTNWSVFTPGTTTITLANVGDKVYFRGDNTTVSESYSTHYRFVMSGKIAASGNIMSLLDKTCQSTTIANNYCYSNMFAGCASLTTAPELPATTLADYCYSNMFYDCYKLKVNTTSGNKIFTCPTTIPEEAVTDMFTYTGGTFTGTPTAGTTYYYTV